MDVRQPQDRSHGADTKAVGNFFDQRHRYGQAGNHRADHKAGHEQRSSIAIRFAFGTRSGYRIGGVRAMTDQALPAMMVPMTELVRDREALPHQTGIGIDGNDRVVTEADDPGITTGER